MEKKNQGLYLVNSAQTQRKTSKPERMIREPPTQRREKFNPLNIMEEDKKERKDVVSAMKLIENQSGIFIVQSACPLFPILYSQKRFSGGLPMLCFPFFWDSDFVKAFLLIVLKFNLIKNLFFCKLIRRKKDYFSKS